ncbi:MULTISPECIES: hypothetical protein [unclassified Psychrobacter]|uniref:hypothetical protein n=1 Tax=unclassified Psychrobacter TaxID=196806 RepID=UPI0025D49742|nr:MULTISPECIES: hypothetical protein [unclassified Psychrobacter]
MAVFFGIEADEAEADDVETDEVVTVVLSDSVEVLGMADLARDKLAVRIVRFFCDNRQFCRASVLIYG